MTSPLIDRFDGRPEPAFPGGDLAQLVDQGVDAELPQAAAVSAENADGAWSAPRRFGARTVVSTAASVAMHLAVLAMFVGAPGAIWRIAGAKDDGKALSGDAAIDVAIVAPPKPQPAPKPGPVPSPPMEAVPQPRAEAPKRQILAAPTAKESADAVPAELGPPVQERARATEAEPPREQAEAAEAPSLRERPELAAAMPIPTPRPDHVPQTEQTASQPAPATGRARDEQRRGTIGGEISGIAASTEAGRADAATGDAAETDYPGSVARQLNAALTYPAEAARQQIKGQARVQFVLDASGRVASVEVIGSSGSDILDRAAIETVRRAAPFPPIPPEAGRAEWPFTVTLAFGR